MAGQAMGGAEAFYSRLVSALEGYAGISQVAITRPHERWLDRLSARQVQTQTCKFGGRFDLATKKRVRQTLRDFDTDVALTWMSRASQHTPTGPWLKTARLGGYYALKYYQDCDHLVGNTQGICRYLRAGGVPADQVWYLPNFVEEQAQPATLTIDRSAYLGTRKTLLLAAGRLHVNKAFDTILHALTQLPDSVLLLAGEGSEQAGLLALADQLGVREQLVLVGWQDDLRPYYAVADAFICASRVEPLGNTVLEAWFNGCPIVAADADGPKELIVDGRTGLLFPREDAAALAACVNKLAGSATLRTDLIAEGQSVYAKGFRREVVLANYADFFQQILARR